MKKILLSPDGAESAAFVNTPPPTDSSAAPAPETNSATLTDPNPHIIQAPTPQVVADPSTPPAVQVTESMVSSAAKILVQLVPAIAPYGFAIDAALIIAEKVAPPAYKEIMALIDVIKGGGRVTSEQLATLGLLISRLKNPDVYFGDAPALEETPPTDQETPPDQRAGFVD